MVHQLFALETQGSDEAQGAEPPAVEPRDSRRRDDDE
jgi:hypothetical protein